MINHYLTNYLRAKVYLKEMDCNGYRKGTYKLRCFRVVKTYWR